MHATLKRLMPGIVLVTLISCATPTSGSVTSVTIDGGDRSLVLGETITLTATVAASGGASTAVTWTSGTESVATIDATGLVTSLATGSTEITATSTADPSVSDTITVTVVKPAALGWTRQFGTASGDYANGIAADGSANVYLVGNTHGALEGASAGLSDAYVCSFDESGGVR